MPDYLLIVNCSPTLAGFKIGSMFNCRFADINEMDFYITKWNSDLNPKGVYAVIFRYTQGRALIYIYRPKNLTNYLNQPSVFHLLSSLGYENYSIDYCLNRLANRIVDGNQFPHEVGLFLGYPVTDVMAFIENKGQNSKYTGYWKAYDNISEAREVFQKWSLCKDTYIRMFFAGKSVVQLTRVV